MSGKRRSLTISEDAVLEVANITDGVFSPLSGFMGRADYLSVARESRLSGGETWTIPVTLDVPEPEVKHVSGAEVLDLVAPNGTVVAEMEPEDVFEADYEKEIAPVYGTADTNHPGVKKEMGRPRHRVGGKVRAKGNIHSLFPEHDLTPRETKAIFKKRGWRTVAGFQTRNPPHLAHEYLQRVALEVADGLFIQPLIGWKKDGDFTPVAIMKSYGVMINEVYPKDRVTLGTLRTPMRYAGPREAVFHAIIRRNYGCSHFIVGRDHAGVGGYYGLYEAQNLALALEGGLGIKILPLAGPFYCKKCRGIATERSCGHCAEDREEVSGTMIRSRLSKGLHPDKKYMRDEIADCLISLMRENKLFN